MEKNQKREQGGKPPKSDNFEIYGGQWEAVSDGKYPKDNLTLNLDNLMIQ
ncbi:MAG: hypothetical protein DHS20C13_22310 [Thermodesulfobacteriota bacterium]|nr:MAG: hypothetical protein DHS20C13_22310 [Thermodesulfobacteriota bacterium]GJM35928.1 MAG: hypothetical protein DHS20C18_49290 [Saprospiraceae bacterium]